MFVFRYEIVHLFNSKFDEAYLSKNLKAYFDFSGEVIGMKFNCISSFCDNSSTVFILRWSKRKMEEFANT